MRISNIPVKAREQSTWTGPTPQGPRAGLPLTIRLLSAYCAGELRYWYAVSVPEGQGCQPFSYAKQFSGRRVTLARKAMANDLRDFRADGWRPKRLVRRYQRVSPSET